MDIKDLALLGSLLINLLLGILELKPKRVTADSAILDAANTLYTNLKNEMTDTRDRLSKAEKEIETLKALLKDKEMEHDLAIEMKDKEVSKMTSAYFEQVQKTEDSQKRMGSRLDIFRNQLLLNGLVPMEFNEKPSKPIPDVEATP